MREGRIKAQARTYLGEHALAEDDETRRQYWHGGCIDSVRVPRSSSASSQSQVRLCVCPHDCGCAAKARRRRQRRKSLMHLHLCLRL